MTSSPTCSTSITNRRPRRSGLPIRSIASRCTFPSISRRARRSSATTNGAVCPRPPRASLPDAIPPRDFRRGFLRAPQRRDEATPRRHRDVRRRHPTNRSEAVRTPREADPRGRRDEGSRRPDHGAPRRTRAGDPRLEGRPREARCARRRTRRDAEERRRGDRIDATGGRGAADRDDPGRVSLARPPDSREENEMESTKLIPNVEGRSGDVIKPYLDAEGRFFAEDFWMVDRLAAMKGASVADYNQMQFMLIGFSSSDPESGRKPLHFFVVGPDDPDKLPNEV